jgi:hypothetical protein
MIPIMLILNPPTPQKNCHSAFKNIQTKNREREIQPPPLESNWMIVASPSKANCHCTFIVKKGPPPPNEPLQLHGGAQQYRTWGHGEYFDTMEFFIA